MSPVIIADGAPIPLRPGQNILAACLAAGQQIPYFCWHPALGSVGSCRQCAVKVFSGPEDQTGQIVMACMTPATPDMRVAIADSDAEKFREQMIELVLTSHPHDCPVCEVGGECHLQDMAVLTGHAARRYRFTKRTHLNQNLGPFIKHEMNRCIGCHRCVRFYRDYAGGGDFGVFGANRNIYFGRAEAGALESEFAGNLVEVCPTGVFVDKPFSARFARKWDLRATPSICPHCAVGCNVTLQERGGEFRRVVNRYNETLNGYFLCDRGRFGTGFLASPKRLRTCRRGTEILHQAQAPAALADFLRHQNVIGIGSPRASLEANFALREVVGPANFYAGLAAPDHDILAAAIAVMQQHAPHIATIGDAAQADAILILGDDPSEIAPILALALRQAVVGPSPDLLAACDTPSWHADAAKRAKLAEPTGFFIATPAPTKLDAAATATFREMPASVTQLAFAIARQIDPTAPGSDTGGPAAALAAALLNARQPLIVVGAAACGPGLMLAAGNIMRALKRAAGQRAKLSLLLPETNSLGLGLMAPRQLADAFAAMPGRRVLVIENDLYRRADATALQASMGTASAICVLDHVETATSQLADLAIAVGSFADGDGTTVNLEGRAQCSFKAIYGQEDPPQSCALLRDAGIAAGRLPAGRWATQRDLLQDMQRQIPALAGCAASPPTAAPRPASLPYRYSGRTAEFANIDVREPAPPRHPEAAFGTTMEGPRPWRAPGWNSVQAALAGQPPAGEISGAFILGAAATPDAYVPPPPIAPPEPGLIFIPVSRVFGSEELSAFAPAIAARMLPPAVTLATADASSLGCQAGEWVICETGNAMLRRAVIIDAAMAAGVTAVTTGFPGEPPLTAAAPGRIRKTPS